MTGKDIYIIRKGCIFMRKSGKIRYTYEITFVCFLSVLTETADSCDVHVNRIQLKARLFV